MKIGERDKGGVRGSGGLRGVGRKEEERRGGGEGFTHL